MVRKTVAAMADQLHKLGYSLSQALTHYSQWHRSNKYRGLLIGQLLFEKTLEKTKIGYCLCMMIFFYSVNIYLRFILRLLWTAFKDMCFCFHSSCVIVVFLYLYDLVNELFA